MADALRHIKPWNERIGRKDGVPDGVIKFAMLEEIAELRDALAPRPAEVDDTTSTLNNPPYGQPDLYSRLHTALIKESALAKEFCKLPEWFEAARGLLDWMELKSKVAPSHTTNKEK